MKKSRQCPKCNSRAIYFIEKVAANEDTGFMQEQPSFRIAVSGKGTDGRTGILEAYCCSECGYVEFYLKEHIRPDGKYIKGY